MQILQRALAALGVAFLVYHFCFETAVVTSNSMAPTLRGVSYRQGDRVLIEKVTGWFRKPKRWEIHFFHSEDGVTVAKRVVGLPGERISLKENKLYVNGHEIPRPRGLEYLTYYPFGNLSRGQEVDCRKGYYLLGDDARDSYDSRFVGPVISEDFHGRVWLILRPVARAGFVR